MASARTNRKTQLSNAASSVDSIMNDERLTVNRNLREGSCHPLERTGSSRVRCWRRKPTPHNHTSCNQHSKQDCEQVDHVRPAKAPTISSGSPTTSANHALHPRSPRKVTFIPGDGDIEPVSRSIRRVTVLRDCCENRRTTSVTPAVGVIGLLRTAGGADILTTDGYIDQCIRCADDALFHVDPIPKGSTTFAAALRAMDPPADETKITEQPGNKNSRTTKKYKSRVRQKPSSTSKVAFSLRNL